MNPLLLTDGYKLGHKDQYPDKTTKVYSNWTARKSRLSDIDYVVHFGLQYFIKEYLIKRFNQNFFNRNKSDVVAEYKKYVSKYLNVDYNVTHIEDLHNLGYLPIRIKSVPEGTFVPIKVPIFTITNTNPRFFWLTNYLETLLSNVIWPATTSATIASQYRILLDKYAQETDPENALFVNWQGHDFSMRGMSGTESAILSGMGHALSFTGSDTFPVIKCLEEYYGADIDKELVIGSVNATEHSVMCAGERDNELETFRRLLKLYPSGILSVVSDTWDLWTVITKYLPQLYDEIKYRDGKLVIRPDSGNPIDIICGDSTKNKNHPAYKGVVELLYDLFGGIVNNAGYKVLDSKIGCIYGDSITTLKAETICRKLREKGFASTNIVFGIGSFTYQYNTRDTFGFALKATYVEVDGKGRNIFKDPITDNGLKKSAKGMVKVFYDDQHKIIFKDQCTLSEENTGLMKLVYENGKLISEETLDQIRKRILTYKES